MPVVIVFVLALFVLILTPFLSPSPLSPPISPRRVPIHGVLRSRPEFAIYDERLRQLPLFRAHGVGRLLPPEQRARDRQFSPEDCATRSIYPLRVSRTHFNSLQLERPDWYVQTVRCLPGARRCRIVNFRVSITVSNEFSVFNRSFIHTSTVG